MIKKLLIPFLLFFYLGANAQLNNSWIDYSKTYYKFKLFSDNLYRIPQSAIASLVPAGTNADSYQLWRNGEQVRLYTSISGAPLGASDYIEFWGQRNDGKADKQLYRAPELQLADYYSLETDTSTYFLTVNAGGSNLRYTNAANPSPGAAVPDAYFMRSIDVYYNGLLNRGFGRNFGEYVHSAAYDEGEGFTSTEIVTGQTTTQNFQNLNVYTSGPANSLSVRTNLYFNTDNSTRRVGVKVFDTEVFTDTHSDVRSSVINVTNLPLSLLQNTSSVPVTISNTDPAPAPSHPIDRMVLHTTGITYPSTFNFNNLRNFEFDLAASATGNYLLIDNFNYGTAAPVLFDINNGKRYVGDILSTPGKVKFVLPASSDAVRKFRLVSMEAANITSVNTLSTKTFINYNTAANRGDYIIISNPQLFNDGSGNNYVDQYRQYRSSVNGGGYNAKVYDINELTDQFAFGIKKHPAAVRDLVRFMDQQFPVKPKFIFLIGHGMNYYDQRANDTNPISDVLNMVPTFGWPASDNLMVSTPGTVVPITPVGRLAAISGAEVNIYLQKMIEYETAQRTQSPVIADKQWMKNVIHVVGGKTEDESNLFRFYMNSYKDIIEDSLYGAKVETFVKSTVATVEQASSQRIAQLFNEGIGFIGYFGHSSANTFELNLANPNTFTNADKYPFFNVSGCSAGNYFIFDPGRLTNNLSLSEKYIFAPQRGSIAFLADTHYGVPPVLNIYNTELYHEISRTNYGKPVGTQIKATMVSVGGNDFDLDYLSRIHLEEINLHGDPALKINNFPKPDYAIEDQSIKISPSIISVADANFNVKVMLRNIGRATNDSIRIYVKRLLPNTTVPVTIYDEKVLAVKNIDSIELTIPINPVTDKGQNQLIVELDYTHLVDEIYETNNKITKSFFIFEDELRPVYPYDYSIVNTQNITFSASTANPLAAANTYRMEIDTTQLFNSPFKKTYTAAGPGGLIQFTPSNLSFTDNTVYYWRTGVVPATGNIIWNGMSFIYLSGSTPGFNQSHYFQYGKMTFQDLTLNPNRVFAFTPKIADYTVRTGVYPSAAETNDYSLENTGFIEQAGFYAPYSTADNEVLRFYVIDSVTLKPWVNVDNGTSGSYGSYRPIPINTSVRPGFFHFDISTPAARQNVVNFLNLIPQGNMIVLTNCPGNSFSHYPTEWATDPGTNLYLKLKGMGFTDLDQLTTHRPYIFATRKGSNVATVQLFGANSTEKIFAQFSMLGSNLRGSGTSDILGLAKKWNSLHWRATSLESPSSDNIKVQVIGVNNSGTEDLLTTVGPAQDTSLAWIDATVYQRLRLKMINTDSVNATPMQLTYWRINADLVPEGAVAPNILYTMKDTVEIGEPITFNLAFKNISPVAFDSLIKVNFRITDNNNFTGNIDIPARKALVSNDTLVVTYSIDSRNYSGNNTLFIEFNPNDHQPEQYHFNNILYKSFYVKPDAFNPLLDVTFDGVHILNKDIVASKPNILVKLKDESRFLALADTSLMKVQIRYPDGSMHNYFFNGDTMRFIPANLAAGENSASIEIKPYFPADGDYELIISGKDVSGNAAGNLNYRISFTVLNKPMISNLLNYPNPFTTSTAFVFTLTGSQVPQNMRIQILTITGKVVRELTKDELGPIHIGRNITEYKWDGTDQYGQKLANGVYIYRVLTNLNGKSLEKYKSADDNTDKFFNKGYGKMYFMR